MQADAVSAKAMDTGMRDLSRSLPMRPRDADSSDGFLLPNHCHRGNKSKRVQWNEKGTRKQFLLLRK